MSQFRFATDSDASEAVRRRAEGYKAAGLFAGEPNVRYRGVLKIGLHFAMSDVGSYKSCKLANSTSQRHKIALELGPVLREELDGADAKVIIQRFDPANRIGHGFLTLESGGAETVQFVQQRLSPLRLMLGVADGRDGLRAVLNIRAIQRKPVTMRMSHFLRPKFLSAVLRDLLQDFVEEVTAKEDLDDLGRVVLQVKCKPGVRVPLPLWLPDRKLAQQMVMPHTDAEVERFCGHMPAVLRRYNPVFDSSVPFEPRADEVLSLDALQDLRKVELPHDLLQRWTPLPPGGLPAAAVAMDVDKPDAKHGREPVA